MTTSLYSFILNVCFLEFWLCLECIKLFLCFCYQHFPWFSSVHFYGWDSFPSIISCFPLTNKYVLFDNNFNLQSKTMGNYNHDNAYEIMEIQKKKIKIKLVFCWVSSGNCYNTKKKFVSIVNPQFMDFICPIHTIRHYWNILNYLAFLKNL